MHSWIVLDQFYTKFSQKLLHFDQICALVNSQVNRLVSILLKI